MWTDECASGRQLGRAVLKGRNGNTGDCSPSPRPTVQEIERYCVVAKDDSLLDLNVAFSAECRLARRGRCNDIEGILEGLARIRLEGKALRIMQPDLNWHRTVEQPICPVH